jgi:Mn-containing catalase
MKGLHAVRCRHGSTTPFNPSISGRGRARPFYDLVSSIATEEFGHVELVAATINTMLTGASPIDDGRAPEAALADVKGVGNPHHFLAGGQARFRRTRRAARGTETTSSARDLIEDLTHNYFLETGPGTTS